MADHETDGGSYPRRTSPLQDPVVIEAAGPWPSGHRVSLTVEEYRELRDAASTAKAQIVGWLRFQEREWRDTSANLGSSVAGNVAAHYAQALHNAIESIESDAPERWAAEREGERG